MLFIGFPRAKSCCLFAAAIAVVALLRLVAVVIAVSGRGVGGQVLG